MGLLGGDWVTTHAGDRQSGRIGPRPRVDPGPARSRECVLHPVPHRAASVRRSTHVRWRLLVFSSPRWSVSRSRWRSRPSGSLGGVASIGQPVFYAVYAVTQAMAGAVIVWRYPRHRIGWVLIAFACGQRGVRGLGVVLRPTRRRRGLAGRPLRGDHQSHLVDRRGARAQPVVPALPGRAPSLTPLALGAGDVGRRRGHGRSRLDPQPPARPPPHRRRQPACGRRRSRSSRCTSWGPGS